MSISEIMEKLRTHAPDAIMPKEDGSSSRMKLRLPTKKVMFTGLDIGTTKICAIIGEIDPQGKVTVLGLASTPSQGLRRGVVINLDETVDSIRIAIRKAEDIAQVSVRDVFVGIAGGHIECHQLTATVDVQNPERGVSKSDIRRVIEKAIQNQAPVEREVLHQIPQRFLIDDGPIIDPMGFCSRKLTVEVLLVTAAVTSAQNIIRAVSQANYRVSGIYLEPLASSLAILTEQEKELGVAMIDIGGGTSDVAIWVDGAVRFTGVVPYGGDAVTEDISNVLKINRFDAENLKKRYGHCQSQLIDPTEMVQAPAALADKVMAYKRQFVAEITEARLEEMLTMVKEKIEKLPCYDRVYGGIVFTGGTSLQQGICDLGERVFNKPCKLGVPTGLSGLAGVVSSPIYATGVGLVLYGLEHEREQAFLDGNAFHRVVKRLKSFIDWYG
ncbi:cell division protein FtsA [soil metagenome]